MARPKNDPLDKLCKALEIGTPLQVALRYSGIPAPEYRHWEDMHLSYFYMLMTEKMKGEDGIELEEPNPDIYARMISSKQYKAECKKAYETVERCRNAQSNSIVRHLSRIASTSYDKATIDASKWFLERALPTEFGSQEKVEETKIKPIEVRFAKPSDESKKRIEDMEREIAGAIGSKA